METRNIENDFALKVHNFDDSILCSLTLKGYDFWQSALQIHSWHTASCTAWYTNFVIVSEAVNRFVQNWA